MNMEENMARFQMNCLIVFVAMAVIPVEMPQKMPSAARSPAGAGAGAATFRHLASAKVG